MNNAPTTIIATEGRWAGHLCWRYADGSVLPVVRGGDGSGEGGAGGAGTGAGDGAGAAAAGGAAGSGTGDAGAGGGDEKTLPQSEVDRIATAQKREGEAAGRRKALEELGITDPEQAKALLAEAEKRRTEELSDAQKAQEKAQREADASTKATAEAKRTTLRANVTLAAVDAGAPRANIADIATLVATELDGNAEPDDEAVTDAVAKVKGRLPALFTEKAEGEAELGPDGKPKPKPTPTAPSSTPQSTPKPQAGDDSLAKAEARAAKKAGAKEPANA